MKPNYFTQTKIVEDKYRNVNRYKYFLDLAKGKSICHVGFVDYPITDLRNNLHFEINKIASDLVGIDPNYKEFLKYQDQFQFPEMYPDFSQVSSKEFDYLFVPEVIEHVGNFEAFLSDLDSLNFKKMIISAPDAFQLYRNGAYNINTKMWIEIVHPDHNCWFSPYTLDNLVHKYMNVKTEELLFLSNHSIVGVYTR